jgi:hypothetical protein
MVLQPRRPTLTIVVMFGMKITIWNWNILLTCNLFLYEFYCKSYSFHISGAHIMKCLKIEWWKAGKH